MFPLQLDGEKEPIIERTDAFCLPFANRCSVDHNSDLALASGSCFRPILDRKAVVIDRDRPTVYNVPINTLEKGNEHARMDRGRNQDQGFDGTVRVVLRYLRSLHRNKRRQ